MKKKRTAPPPPVLPPAQASPVVPLSLPERVELTKDILYIVAIAAAGVWALTTFWYQSVYLPARERPLLTYVATTRVMGEKDGRLAIAVEVTVKNDGKVAQEFWGTVISAHGVWVPVEATDGGWSEAEASPTAFRGSRGYRATVDPKPIAIEADIVSMRGRRLIVSSHAESMIATFTFFVTRADYDAVQVEVDLLQAIAVGQPQPDWFALKNEPTGDVSIEATAACKADTGCGTSYFHTNVSRLQSLWDR